MTCSAILQAAGSAIDIAFNCKYVWYAWYVYTMPLSLWPLSLGVQIRQLQITWAINISLGGPLYGWATLQATLLYETTALQRSHTCIYTDLTLCCKHLPITSIKMAMIPKSYSRKYWQKEEGNKCFGWVVKRAIIAVNYCICDLI